MVAGLTELLLGVAIGAVVVLTSPGQVAPAIDVLFQPLVVLFKALAMLVVAALLQALVGLLLSQWASNDQSCFFSPANDPFRSIRSPSPAQR